MGRKLFALFTAVIMMFVFAGCQSGGAGGTLVVGVTDDYPPMGYRNTAGELVGFEVDLAEALADEMGMDLEFVVIHREEMMGILKDRQVDALISSVSITDDKLGYLDFSDPYLENGHVIVTRKDLVDTIVSIDSLAGMVAGVEKDSTVDAIATSQKGIIDFTLIKYETMSVCIAALKAEQLDCILCDMAVAIDICDKFPDSFAVSSAHLTDEPLAIALNFGSEDLKKQINSALKNLRNDGTLSKISEEHLGGDYS